MRVGTIDDVIQAVFAILASILILTLFVPKVAEPTLSGYGSEQAYIVAQDIASTINALSVIDKGWIEKKIGKEWNIKIYTIDGKQYIEVNHNKFNSKKIEDITFLGKTQNKELTNVNKIILLKQFNGIVEIYSEFDPKLPFLEEGESGGAGIAREY